MPQEKEQAKVFFKYEQSDGYRIVHATGARGALTPNGDILFELFTEFALMPSEEIRRLNPNGTLGELECPQPRKQTVEMFRQLQVGVVVSPGDAETIGKWLLKKVEEAKSRQAIVQSKKVKE